VKVLFVDDEEAVLSGLRRMLRRHAADWETCFVVGGEAALDCLQEDRFDVVVTDMRMPGVDGATVLGAARDRHPGTVRIVLSGHNEMASALRAVPLAHQYLTKPCDPLELRGAVHRALRLQESLDRTGLLSVIGGVDLLPSPPAAIRELEALLGEREVDVDRVVDVVSADPAISAKLLQLVNSAFFGVARRVADVGTAVRYLGIVTVRDLAVAAHAFGSLTREGPNALVEDIQAHSIQVAELTQLLIGPGEQRHDAFAAALLHDIGRLVLAARATDAYAALVQTASPGRPLHELEREAFGASHAEIGALFLSLWGLPYPIVEVVLSHHRPRVVQSPFSTADATFLAEQLLHAMPPRHGAGHRVLDAEGPGERLPDEVLASPAVVRALAIWRERTA
jgi:HD-like signal output (HDOD) protein/CheY-like chemotaxis protein